MFELKTLSPEGVPAALEKALRYRMLNEPEQAESICEDVLRLEPDNQEALVMLILALTDRFDDPRPAPPPPADAPPPAPGAPRGRGPQGPILASWFIVMKPA